MPLKGKKDTIYFPLLLSPLRTVHLLGQDCVPSHVWQPFSRDPLPSHQVRFSLVVSHCACWLLNVQHCRFCLLTYRCHQLLLLLFRPFGMTLPYGRSPDKEPPLLLTDFIYWVGRRRLCGASNSFFSAIRIATCLKTPSRGEDILERTS